MDKPEYDQWHEDMERKQEYYPNIIFPERLKILHKKEEDKWKP